MITTLLLDVCRRKLFSIAFVIFQTYLLCKMVMNVFGSDASVGALALAGFGQIGMSQLAFRSREHYMLPVSRQTWWRAEWWVATTGVSAMAVIGATLAAWEVREQVPAIASISLIFALCFLYCGVVQALQARFKRSLDAPATLASMVPVMFLTLGTAAGPFVLARWLPHAWSDIGLVWAAVLLLAAVLSVVGYRYQPPIEARLSMRGPKPVRLAGAADANAVPARPAFADRLSGWRLVAWDEGRKCLYLYCVVIGFSIVSWAVASFFRPVPDLVTFLRNADAFPFSSPVARITEPITWGFVVFASAFLDPWMVSSLRPLRALPMSAGRLAALPVAMGLLASITFALLLLVLHLVILQTLPVALRLDLFLAFAAVIAIGYTIRVMAPGRPQAATASMAPTAIIWLVLGYFSDDYSASTVQTAALVAAPVCLVVSYLVMRFALTRQSRLYRPRPLPSAAAVAS